MQVLEAAEDSLCSSWGILRANTFCTCFPNLNYTERHSCKLKKEDEFNYFCSRVMK